MKRKLLLCGKIFKLLTFKQSFHDFLDIYALLRWWLSYVNEVIISSEFLSHIFRYLSFSRIYLENISFAS